MVSDDRPLTRWHRHLSVSVGRQCRTASGTRVLVRAYMYGMRPMPTQAGDFLVPVLATLRDLARYYEYRVEHRGAWVVEISELHPNKALVERVFDGRASAIAKFEDVRTRLPSVLVADITEEVLG